MDKNLVANLKAITDMVSLLIRPVNTPIPSDLMPESIWERRLPLFSEALISLIVDYATEQNRKESYLEALKNKNYEIDKEGKALLKEGEKEITFSPKELLALFEKLKEGIFKTLFQYTKFSRPIHDEDSLENYLKQTKTFQVNLIGPGKEKEKIAKDTERKTKNLYALANEVKVQELISTYIYCLPSNYPGRTKKTQLVNIGKNYFLAKIRNLDVDFYSLTLKEQQVFFDTWYLEYEKSKEVNLFQAIEMMLKLEATENISYLFKSLTGLILLYGRILSQTSEIDYDNISLSEIEIKVYDSTEVQEQKEKISSLQTQIDTIKSHKEKKNIAIELPQEEQTQLFILEAKKRELDAAIKDKITAALSEIATNNNLKMQEVIIHMQSGVVWVTKEKLLVIKDTNPNTGKIIFEATVPVSSLFEIMKCIEGKLNTPKYGMH